MKRKRRKSHQYYWSWVIGNEQYWNDLILYWNDLILLKWSWCSLSVWPWPGITGVRGWRGRCRHLSKAASARGAAVLRGGGGGAGGGGEAGAGAAGVGLLPAVEDLTTGGDRGQDGLRPLHHLGLGDRLLGGFLGLFLNQVSVANLPRLLSRFGSLQRTRFRTALYGRFWSSLRLVLILASFVDDDAPGELLLLGESRGWWRRPDEDISVNPRWKTWTFQRSGLWYTPNTHLAIGLGSVRRDGSDQSLVKIFETYLYKYFHLLSPYNPDNRW